MANPRKFSEKIALHNQKQAEETAEFERIMREVSDVTSKVGKSLIFFNTVGVIPGICPSIASVGRSVDRSPRNVCVRVRVPERANGTPSARV